jgi:hypothetical protein
VCNDKPEVSIVEKWRQRHGDCANYTLSLKSRVLWDVTPSVTTQKTILLIVTAVRTASPTEFISTCTASLVLVVSGVNTATDQAKRTTMCLLHQPLITTQYFFDFDNYVA